MINFLWEYMRSFLIVASVLAILTSAYMIGHTDGRVDGISDAIDYIWDEYESADSPALFNS